MAVKGVHNSMTPSPDSELFQNNPNNHITFHERKSFYLQIKQKKKRGIRFKRGYCQNNKHNQSNTLLTIV